MAETSENPADEEPCYEIYVLDNYHHGDDGYTLRGFRTAEEALAKCQAIIDADLEGCSAENDTPEAIYGCYKAFGEDPLIFARNGAPGIEFSGWDYAKARAQDFARKGGTTNDGA